MPRVVLSCFRLHHILGVRIEMVLTLSKLKNVVVSHLLLKLSFILLILARLTTHFYIIYINPLFYIIL